MPTIQQLGDAVAPTRSQEDGGYYGRRQTLARLIADATIEEIAELIKLNKLSWEVKKIVELLPHLNF